MSSKRHSKRVRFSRRNSTRRIPRRVLRKQTPFKDGNTKRKITLRRRAKRVVGGQ